MIINEQNQCVTFHTPEGKLEFAVGQKYPLPLPDEVEGETLLFADNLLINMLWQGITETEKQFLRDLCDGISIYQDEVNRIIIIVFIFSGRPIILPVTDDEESVQAWMSKQYNNLIAFFFLTEATNHKIQQIRNLNLPANFASALQLVLTGYKQPDFNAVQNLVITVNPEIAFKQAKFRWLYSEEQGEFLFVPPEVQI